MSKLRHELISQMRSQYVETLHVCMTVYKRSQTVAAVYVDVTVTVTGILYIMPLIEDQWCIIKLALVRSI